MEDDDDAAIYERDEDEPEAAVKAPSLHLGAVLASKDASTKRKSAPKRKAAAGPEPRSPVQQGGNVGGARVGGGGSSTGPGPTPTPAPGFGVGGASSTRPRSRSRSPGGVSSVKKTPKKGQQDAGLEHDPEMAKVNDRLGGNKQCLRALQIQRHLCGEKLSE